MHKLQAGVELAARSSRQAATDGDGSSEFMDGLFAADDALAKSPQVVAKPYAQITHTLCALCKDSSKELSFSSLAAALKPARQTLYDFHVLFPAELRRSAVFDQISNGI